MNGNGHGFVSASQIRAARALLNWSQDELAKAAGLSVATIRKLELGHISPRSATTAQIRTALEDAGLEFIEPEGVRQRPDDIRIYQGRDGFMEFFMNDVYPAARDKGGDFICVRAAEFPFGYMGLHEEQLDYIRKMDALRNRISVKCILTEDHSSLWAPYCEYRSISKHYVDSVPFYVYDDKYAIILLNEQAPKITVLRSRTIADAFRRQFYSMWEKAVPLNNPGQKETLRGKG